VSASFTSDIRATNVPQGYDYKSKAIIKKNSTSNAIIIAAQNIIAPSIGDKALLTPHFLNGSHGSVGLSPCLP